jgi:hypothetical protein
MAEKLPFEIRLANAIQKYQQIFKVHPPIFGYDDDGELYNLLLNCIDTKVELPGIEDRIIDEMDITEDDSLYI